MFVVQERGWLESVCRVGKHVAEEGFGGKKRELMDDGDALSDGVLVVVVLPFGYFDRLKFFLGKFSSIDT